MADEHVFIYSQDFLGDDYTASCSCGWEARGTFGSSLAAQGAWDDHCDVVFMEATGG